MCITGGQHDAGSFKEEKTLSSLRAHQQRAPGKFRIESDCGLNCSRLDSGRAKVVLVHDRSVAVAMAAKTLGHDCKGEVRVVYAPTGEVIFRKQN